MNSEMKRRRRVDMLMAAVICAAAALALWLGTGCGLTAQAPQVSVPLMPQQDGTVRRAVVFGLDRVDPARYGGWDGDCPGAVLDAERMRDLLLSRGYTVFFLTEANATAFRVAAACVAAGQGMKAGDRLVVYGSGHGGQIPDLSGDEAAGFDQTLCLWDGHFTDDLVWEMLKKVPEGAEVDLITDCCNSGTNFRARPRDYAAVFRARPRPGSSLRCALTHMGGCGDDEYSYGSAEGGVFTISLLKAWRPGLTRREWFSAAAARMPRNQTPVLNWMGTDVLEGEALR